jgi:hypothetical protein
MGDVLHFSPKYRFIDLKWDDKDNLIRAFQDRVEGFYVRPAKKLNQEKESAFAVGVLCVATVDFLARIETGSDKVKERFEKWVRSNIEQFNKANPDDASQTLAYRFYDEFRNGLVHEGRIKNAGHFSYDCGELVDTIAVNGTGRVMRINPDILLGLIAESLEKYLHRLRNEEFAFQAFRCALTRDFQRDVEYAMK